MITEKEFSGLLFLSRFYEVPRPAVFTLRDIDCVEFVVHSFGGTLEQNFCIYPDASLMMYNDRLGNVYRFDINQNRLEFGWKWGIKWHNISAKIKDSKDSKLLQEKFKNVKTYDDLLDLHFALLHIALDCKLSQKLEGVKVSKDGTQYTAYSPVAKIVYDSDYLDLEIHTRNGVFAAILPTQYHAEMRNVSPYTIYSLVIDPTFQCLPFHYRWLHCRRAFCEHNPPVKIEKGKLVDWMHWLTCASFACRHYVVKSDDNHKVSVTKNTDGTVEIEYVCLPFVYRVECTINPNEKIATVDINGSVTRPILEEEYVEQFLRFVEDGNISDVVRYMVALTKVGEGRWQ